VPPEDQSADFYIAACERLEQQGIRQYEISNFARVGYESRHNNKYWTRAPYLGLGLDAHSMLLTSNGEAVRLATTDSMDNFLAGASEPKTTVVHCEQAFEEEWFLGLRMVRGVELDQIAGKYGNRALERVKSIVNEAIADGLLERVHNRVRLTQSGRLLSNEVFERFLGEPISA
jgi:oxygen-independent coproporphyrinogen-3 oxidase